MELKGACCCGGRWLSSEIFDFPVKQLGQPWIDKVPSTIVFVFLLDPVNGNIAVIFQDCILDMLMRKRSDLLYPYNGNVLQYKT